MVERADVDQRERLFARGPAALTDAELLAVLLRTGARGAAAVIFAHNHPSGVAEPSQADELITRRLREAMALVDIRILDHLIVAGTTVLSFAERGLL